MAAASVGLSMAIISLAKLLLVICGLAMLLLVRRPAGKASPLAGTFTPVAVLTALAAFGLSLLWTAAPLADALGAVTKYGKLIVIVLMLLLIRDRREAMYALGAFGLAQLFLLLSSWMLFMQLPVPWATSRMALTYYAVFSSYLDQGIIGAVFAALCWHLRFLVPGRFGPHLAVLVALLALGNVFFILNGRSGHVVAIALLSLAIMWELPRSYRAAVLVLPFVLALGLYASSTKVRERLSLVGSEVQFYSSDQEPVSSSGIRLHFWHRAVQVISQNPLAGSGVGSWGTEYHRLQREHNAAYQTTDGHANPHQEYLLWGVQLGIPGILLFLGLLLAVLRDTLKMEPPYARAAQSVLLALAVACLFNASLYDAQIGDFFCVLLGLLLASGLAGNTTGRAIHSQREPAT
ncbi:MAG: O-antigen ligase family protein [Pseudomonadota bacterium]|nr:O-antigen ligase family protein [Pseudomonadota bacterium]